MTAVAGNADTVRTFLKLLEDGNIDGWIELWADGARHHYPFGTRMFPPLLTGRQAIHDRWKDMPGRFRRLAFPLRELWEDGDTVIARFDGDLVLADGTPYRNAYICVFTFDAAGKIAEYREYFDPIVAGVAFGLAEVTYLT